MMKTILKIALFGALTLAISPLNSALGQQQQLLLEGFNDVTLNPGSGMLQLGDTDGPNLALDRNEIQGRNNGSSSSLFLNIEGSDVKTGSTDSPSNFWATGFLRSGITSYNPRFKFHHVSGTISGAVTFGIDLNLPAGVTTDDVVLVQCNVKNPSGFLVPKTNYSYNSTAVSFTTFFDDGDEYHISVIYIE